MSISKKLSRTLAVAALVMTTACGTTYSTIQGQRIQGEIVRDAGGFNGDDVTTGVLDYADHFGNVRSETFLVTSTSFAKMITTAVVPGALVSAVQSDIARYQVDNQCDSACGDVINILTQAAANSETITQVEVDAVASIMNSQGGGSNGW